MARTKKLNFVVDYGGTGYYCNDLGEDKKPRFELYYEPSKKSVMKSDNPIDFDAWLKKDIWKGVDFNCDEC